MNKIVLFDIDYTIFDTAQFKNTQLQEFSVYEEVLDVLQEVATVATLGIFSEGNYDFQKSKLEKTNILQHFVQEHVHIVVKKDEELEAVLKKYSEDQLFLIDDKLTILQKAKIMMPMLYTIWVKRGEYATAQGSIIGFKADAEVTTLRNVVEIIKNN